MICERIGLGSVLLSEACRMGFVSGLVSDVEKFAPPKCELVDMGAHFKGEAQERRRERRSLPG